MDWKAGSMKFGDHPKSNLTPEGLHDYELVVLNLLMHDALVHNLCVPGIFKQPCVIREISDRCYSTQQP